MLTYGQTEHATSKHVQSGNVFHEVDFIMHYQKAIIFQFLGGMIPKEQSIDPIGLILSPLEMVCNYDYWQAS